MRWLLSPAILLALTLSCEAAEVRCPPLDKELSPPEQWKYEYGGWVMEVQLYKYYGDVEKHSLIFCFRTIGVRSLYSSRTCRIIAGDGDLQMKPQLLKDTDLF